MILVTKLFPNVLATNSDVKMVVLSTFVNDVTILYVINQACFQKCLKKLKLEKEKFVMSARTMVTRNTQ